MCNLSTGGNLFSVQKACKAHSNDITVADGLLLRFCQKLVELYGDGAIKQCYVFAVPPFPFPCSSSSAFEAPERLAKIEYFMLHTISLPGHTDPCSHLFACMFWPMVHPNLHHYGKPVQVWSKDIYEPHLMNKFCLASCISSRAIMSYDRLQDECVCIAIPVVE